MKILCESVVSRTKLERIIKLAANSKRSSSTAGRAMQSVLRGKHAALIFGPRNGVLACEVSWRRTLTPRGLRRRRQEGNGGGCHHRRAGGGEGHLVLTVERTSACRAVSRRKVDTTEARDGPRRHCSLKHLLLRSRGKRKMGRGDPVGSVTYHLLLLQSPYLGCWAAVRRKCCRQVRRACHPHPAHTARISGRLWTRTCLHCSATGMPGS